MSPDPRPNLHDILDRIERIERYTAEGRQAFLDTDWQQDAVIRCFEVIGEAIKRLDSTVLEQQTQVSWRGFAGFRDMLIHQYDRAVMEWVWQYSQEDLPALKAGVTALLHDLDEG